MIVLDFETRSYADLGKVGAWNYSLDPTTEVIVMAYLIDAEVPEGHDWGAWTPGVIQRWEPGDENPGELFNAIEAGLHVEAHNASFEEAIWQNVMVARHGWPEIPGDNWRDTMASACYLALPASLDKLSAALGGEGKDPEGSRLISRYSKLYNKSATKDITDEDMEKWRGYVTDDVAQEAGIGDYLGCLPERELAIFLLDRRINRRGLYLDADGIAAASAIVDQRSAELSARFREITGFNPTQNAKVQGWLAEQGSPLPDLQKDTIQDALKDNEVADEVEVEPGFYEVAPVDESMSDLVREALTLKLAVSKASTRKLDAMARNAGPDGRARNQTRYHGATTGRSTGMGIQPLNLVRGFEDVPPELLVQDIMRRDAEYLDLAYGDAMDAISKASRHWIQAEPGAKLMAADFVSVEAVILACLAGEQWKIYAFRNKEKIYERMGDKIYGLPAGTVTKKSHPLERQDGKIGELAFGYQGALGAWRGFDKSDRHSDERVIEICKAWRKEHPATVTLWAEYQRCMMHALAHPGSIPEYRGVRFQKIDEWLTIRLLNGKRLWYFGPQFREQMPAWHKPKEKEDCKAGTCDCRPQMTVTYMSMKGGRWRRVSTYGGKITENVVQAHSREILESVKLNLDATPEFKDTIILSVYDEIVAEVPDDRAGATLDRFIELMGYKEDWYADWPIVVDGWAGTYYRK